MTCTALPSSVLKFTRTPESDPLVTSIHEGLDAELNELTYGLAQAKAAASEAAVCFARGDLLGAALQIRVACDHEYAVLANCDHCGGLAEQITRAHVGPVGEACEAHFTHGDCAICAALIVED